MTKEELEQEAEEWLCNNLHSANEEDFINAMVDIAEPREKRIAELIALINAERERQEKQDYKKGWQDGAEFGFNKANEWHYPSKGELPKCDEKTQLIFYVTCYYRDITRKRMVLGYYQKSFINDDVKLFVEKSKGYEDEHLPEDVIAWKEIVLPELEERE